MRVSHDVIYQEGNLHQQHVIKPVKTQLKPKIYDTPHR